MSFIGQLHEERKSVSLDRLDRKILYLLALNGRYGISSIAKALNTSKEVIHYRLKRLEEEGFFHGVLTLVDHQKLGQCIYEVSLAINPTENLTSMLNFLVSHSCVNYVGLCSAPHDAQFQVTTRTAEEFRIFLNTFLTQHHALIQDYNIMQIMENYFTGLGFLLEPEDKIPRILEHKGPSFARLFLMQETGNYVLDAKDKEILRILIANGRVPILQLTKQMHLAQTSVQNRIGVLIAYGFIKNFISYYSVSYLGYQWFHMQLRTKGMDEKKLLTFLQQHKNSAWLTKTLGCWNYRLSIFAKNNTELNTVIQDVRNQFQDTIIDYDTSIVFQQLKYMPVVL